MEDAQAFSFSFFNIALIIYRTTFTLNYIKKVLLAQQSRLNVRVLLGHIRCREFLVQLGQMGIERVQFTEDNETNYIIITRLQVRESTNNEMYNQMESIKV